MESLLLKSLSILEQYTPRYNLAVDNLGIVTAGDSNVFTGIQILHASIKNKINFLCYDIGFTNKQKKWAAENKLNIKPFNVSNETRKINKWQTFLKPWFIEESPFEYTIWVDSDCIVTGDLSLSSFICERKTFFIQYWIKQELLRKNSRKLYKKFPIKSQDLPYVNAGVFGINKSSHQLLLNDWKMLVNEGFEQDSNLLQEMVNWDEGALNWALQNNNAKDCIFDDFRYNCFSSFASSHKEELFDTYHQNVFVLEGSTTFPQIVFRKILQNKDPYILHYSTCMDNKQKYWTQWQQHML